MRKGLIFILILMIFWPPFSPVQEKHIGKHELPPVVVPYIAPLDQELRHWLNA